jgi:hypothetical protein
VGGVRRTASWSPARPAYLGCSRQARAIRDRASRSCLGLRPNRMGPRGQSQWARSTWNTPSIGQTHPKVFEGRGGGRALRAGCHRAGRGAWRHRRDGRADTGVGERADTPGGCRRADGGAGGPTGRLRPGAASTEAGLEARDGGPLPPARSAPAFELGLLAQGAEWRGRNGRAIPRCSTWNIGTGERGGLRRSVPRDAPVRRRSRLGDPEVDRGGPDRSERRPAARRSSAIAARTRCGPGRPRSCRRG